MVSIKSVTGQKLMSLVQISTLLLPSLSLAAPVDGRLGTDNKVELNQRDGVYGLGTAWSDCHNQLVGAHVTYKIKSPGTIFVAGIPSACMTLSTVVTGTAYAGNPVPMGTDSLEFCELTEEQITKIVVNWQAQLV